ncbi:hypothetical protein BRADI_4g42635v3 [Brachypodium distachyon]|uniref:Uncharacterized protein n=1 Tax=Brachypodium distachyon TaxID=15368 RepID=A0A2K2CTU3_BRADI|nr:hypothetical protein BRADI_4g42635v3 [Brachypodium distachyon]
MYIYLRKSNNNSIQAWRKKKTSSFPNWEPTCNPPPDINWICPPFLIAYIVVASLIIKVGNNLSPCSMVG